MQLWVFFTGQGLSSYSFSVFVAILPEPILLSFIDHLWYELGPVALWNRFSPAQLNPIPPQGPIHCFSKTDDIQKVRPKPYSTTVTRLLLIFHSAIFQQCLMSALVLGPQEGPRGESEGSTNVVTPEAQVSAGLRSCRSARQPCRVQSLEMTVGRLAKPLPSWDVCSSG